jgi:hypothetical protein
VCTQKFSGLCLRRSCPLNPPILGEFEDPVPPNLPMLGTREVPVPPRIGRSFSEELGGLNARFLGGSGDLCTHKSLKAP